MIPGGGAFNRNARMALNPNKKEGGVKLLDITEQPIGQAAMKKRKRQQELEDAKKFAEESKNDSNKPETGNQNTKTSKETPDYAAGLSTLNPPTPAPPPAYAPPTPAYAPPTPSAAPPPPVPAPPATNTVLLSPPQLPTAPLPLTSTALPTQPLPPRLVFFTYYGHFGDVWGQPGDIFGKVWRRFGDSMGTV